MVENEISGQVVDAAIEVHRELGPGLLESVYERALGYELTSRGLRVQQQAAVTFCYKEIRFDEGFRADILVEDRIVVELKSVEAITNVHRKQLLSYLK